MFLCIKIIIISIVKSQHGILMKFCLINLDKLFNSNIKYAKRHISNCYTILWLILIRILLVYHWWIVINILKLWIYIFKMFDLNKIDWGLNSIGISTLFKQTFSFRSCKYFRFLTRIYINKANIISLIVFLLTVNVLSI